MSLLKNNDASQSTSKTKSSHLIYYIYSYNFLHSNSISKTQVHLMYYFQILLNSKCVFFIKSRCSLCQWLTTTSVFTETPSKLSTQLLSDQLLEQEAHNQQKINFFQKFIIFPRKNTFSKTVRTIEHLQNKVFSPHLLHIQL